MKIKHIILLISLMIYTFLFLLIGPKFELWEVARNDKEGKQVYDAIDRFVWGKHENGVIQLCFEGMTHGHKGEFFFTITEEQLKAKEENSLGAIVLFTKDILETCPITDQSNILLEVLPKGAFQTRNLINDNVQFLDSLPGLTYLFLFSMSHTGELSRYSFVLNWTNDREGVLFYNFRLRGNTHEDIDVSILNYISAFLEDYLTWPHVLFLLLSGAASHSG